MTNLFGDQGTSTLQELQRDKGTLFLHTNILAKMKRFIKELEHKNNGIPFDEFQAYIVKLRNAFIYILYGKGLLSPFNYLLIKDSPNIFLH